MSEQQPVAWMFLNPDGSVKFVLHDKARAEAGGREFDGKVIALLPLAEKTKQA